MSIGWTARQPTFADSRLGGDVFVEGTVDLRQKECAPGVSSRCNSEPFAPSTSTASLTPVVSMTFAASLIQSDVALVRPSEKSRASDGCFSRSKFEARPRGPLRLFDYLLVESTGISEPLPVAEPRLGRRTVLTFPLLPPPQKN